MIFGEFKALNKTLEVISTKEKESGGRRAIKTLRMIPILLSFIRKCPWDSPEQFAKYLND